MPERVFPLLIEGVLIVSGIQLLHFELIYRREAEETGISLRAARSGNRKRSGRATCATRPASQNQPWWAGDEPT